MTTAAWVPSIDISAARRGSEHRRRVADEIDAACRTSGFLKLRGHGVDPGLIATMRDVTTEFFVGPIEIKEACAAQPADPARRGFHRMGRVAASIGLDTPPDLCENFSINRLTATGHDSPWPNRWPASPATFQAVWLDYIAAMDELASELMRLFAIALGVDECWFDPFIDRNMSNLAANFYPAQQASPEAGQSRKGPHTDWGSLTILLQDVNPSSTASGLQVRRADGSWLDVPPTSGELVVNIGDLMAIWTNDRWVSTMHRVVNPMPGDRSARLSLAYFHQPNDDAEIATIPTCGTADGAPVTSGEWFRRKLQLAFGASA